MADTLTCAHYHAQAAPAAGHGSLAPDVLSAIRHRYRGADFAIIQSYLSTATKWGLDGFTVLTQLFTTGAWLPTAATPG